MDKYVNTVDDVESITGFNIFPVLHHGVKNEIVTYAILDGWM